MSAPPDWFKTLYPKGKVDFPPALKLELNKPVEVEFTEREPRIVPGGQGRRAGVIEVKHKGKPRSVYISNIDLARGLRRLQNAQQSASLEGVKVVIEFIKKGRYNKYRIDNP
jgi:hypothetical protein